MSKTITVIIISISILAAAGVGWAVLSDSGGYVGEVSDHFDGRRFFNPEPDHSFADMITWLWQMIRVEWPTWVDDPPQPTPPERISGKSLRVTYVNQATFLIQTGGLNILTDPIWSDRAGPVTWAGTKRVRAPGIALGDVPAIDVILISHNHYDHLDLPTLRLLARRDHPRILVGLGVGRLLNEEGMAGVTELDWWDETVVSSAGIRIVFVPARHTSGRSIGDGDRTLWGGFVIDGPGGRIYFAGDTGYGKFLQAIKERFDGFRLAILPVGNYEKRWFMKGQHMNPDDAVAVHRLLNVQGSVGMHYATFREHPEQSIHAHEKDLAAALHRYGVEASAFRLLGFGEGLLVGE